MEEKNQLEQWKIINNFPNYKISNTGIVKIVKTGKEMKKHLHGKYHAITLTDTLTKKRTPYLFHRLIAENFIENPDPVNFKYVDHIDRNKINNSIDNLRWCNASMNAKNTNTRKANKVEQYTLKGEFIQTWDSAICAGKELNITYEGIRSCCSGNFRVHKGFIWKYENKDIKKHLNPIIDMNDYKCLGIIKEEDFSNYYISNDGSKIINKETRTEIKIYKTDYNYKKVQIKSKNKIKVHLYVHKIINQVLKGGKYEDIVDHVDGEKDNNSIDNLEAVTIKENTIRALGKSVKQIDIKTGETINIFRTVTEAALFLNKTNGGLISIVCKRKRLTGYGYKWEYI